MTKLVLDPLHTLFPLTQLTEEEQSNYWSVSSAMTDGFSDQFKLDVVEGKAEGYYLSDWLLLEELQVLTYTHDLLYFVIRKTPPK